ncbi:MAG: chemotaxis protein CheB [Terriglobia bacterium]
MPSSQLKRQKSGRRTASRENLSVAVVPVGRQDAVAAPGFITGRKGTLGTRDSFAVVAIGASAGGLVAFTQLLHALPNSTGMTFVFIQHLDPTHHSMLAELLAKESRMPVVEAKNGAGIKPNHVYVIPPNVNMGIRRRRLQLTPRAAGPGVHTPIDFFMRSLAGSHRSRSIGVVLSGTASDGTRGLAAIKAEGGIRFAQSVMSLRDTPKHEEALTHRFAAPPTPSGIGWRAERAG